METQRAGKKRTRSSAMEISIKTVKGKTINLEVDDNSETIDLKIHGPTRQLVIRLGPEPGSDSDQDSDEEGVIRMIISTLNGKTYNVKVKETETIANVKTKIHGQGGPPVDEQRLMYEGRQLIDNWRTVAHYRVKTGSTLVMMSRLCGC
ncbi:hypothetical protein AALP_AA6G338400 [Arabis alpina]|uniref:Ubiquitin-like domain-containing protein n=1 Tax=Arabis alpina TaxID=50452 RepID=A0A087GTF9_ARAAL|nr:hypothetical protein AALP_AA6G338400 [Arabis alpina]